MVSKVYEQRIGGVLAINIGIPVSTVAYEEG